MTPAAPLSVSVALATYNGERFVEQQLRSILTQSPAPIEVIVADDGSTDDTLAVVARVAAEFDDVPVRILEPGARLGVTRNFERAIIAASGDLVALSDQDDLWHPERLASIVARFEDDPQLTLAHHDARLVDESGHPLGTTLLESLYVSDDERARIADDRAFEVFVRRNLATGATVVFRRSLLDDALPLPARWVHDEWLAIIAAAVGRVRLLDGAFVDYRQHGNNAIGVNQPTLRYRVRRMFAKRGDRYVDLAARSAELAARVAALPSASRWAPLAARKAAFEAQRAAYPDNRFSRLPSVFRERRRYAELSSQGTLDIVRDAVHPA